MNSHIEKLVETCLKYSILTAQHISSWSIPINTWSRLHIDFAGPFLNKKWLLVIDAKSKFAHIQDMGNNTTSTSTINALENTFTTYGYCNYIVSDKGPPSRAKILKVT